MLRCTAAEKLIDHRCFIARAIQWFTWLTLLTKLCRLVAMYPERQVAARRTAAFRRLTLWGSRYVARSPASH